VVAFLELSPGKGSRALPPRQPTCSIVMGGSSSVSEGKLLAEGPSQRF
jgi:hypothetical protein